MNQAELSNLRHELRTPINAIIGYSEMLIEDIAEEEQDNTNSLSQLETIQLEGNELLTQINHILEPITATLNYCSLNSRDILETSSKVNRVANTCQILLDVVEDVDYRQDIYKIQTSAHTLQTLLESLLNSCLQDESKLSNQEPLNSILSSSIHQSHLSYNQSNKSSNLNSHPSSIPSDSTTKSDSNFLAKESSKLNQDEKLDSNKNVLTTQSDFNSQAKQSDEELEEKTSLDYNSNEQKELVTNSSPRQSNSYLGYQKQSDFNSSQLQLVKDNPSSSTSKIIPSNKASSSVVKSGNILVVDDNENNRDILVRQLQKEGYKVTTAIGGIEALEILRNREYDLILLDLLMPGLNGYQVLQKLKDNEQWQKIPVIMISASDEVDNVVQCIEIGAEDYIPKPFNSILLKAKIGASLERKRLRDREQEYLQQMEEYSHQLNQEITISRRRGQQNQINSVDNKDKIDLQVWAEEVRFRPGFTTPTLNITVTNNSDRFVSYLLDLIPAGVSEKINFYQLSPDVSTKIPPGASSQFIFTIVKNPEPGFIGMMNLTVQVYCLEFNSEVRDIVRLIVEPGLDLPSLQLQLTEPNLQVYPQTQLIIPLSIYNPSKTPIEAKLSLSGLTFDWFKEGLEQKITLLPKKWTSTQWIADIPEFDVALAQEYSFTIQGNYENAKIAIVRGNLEILAVGETILKCENDRFRIPQKRAWLLNWFSPAVIYRLDFINNSNIPQQVSLDIQQEEKKPCQIKLNPHEKFVLPKQQTTFELEAKGTRPLFGWGKEKLISIDAILSDPRLEITPAHENVILKLLPVIPRWLQTTIGLILLTLIIWWLELPGHFFDSNSRIYSVRFNGMTDEVVAGSSERFIYQWNRRGDNLSSKQVIARTDKPVRTIQYRPLNNDQLATGLENGEILIWDLLADEKKPLYNFTFEKDDRVLSLEYSLDSRYLFSAHGSGLVLQWYVGEEDLFALNRNEPTKKREFDFAVYDLALVGEERKTLAVAGRFNQLKLWNYNQNQVTSLPYQAGGQMDYINSIASPSQKPFWLSIADNQGTISIWDIESCLRGDTQCEVIDSWQHSTDNTSVNSIAISDNGCYLASADDNGEIKLWILNLSGERQTKYNQGLTIASMKRKVNHIDLRIADDKVLIVSGEDNGKVHLHDSGLINQDCGD